MNFSKQSFVDTLMIVFTALWIVCVPVFSAATLILANSGVLVRGSDRILTRDLEFVDGDKYLGNAVLAAIFYGFTCPTVLYALNRAANHEVAPSLNLGILLTSERNAG